MGLADRDYMKSEDMFYPKPTSKYYSKKVSIVQKIRDAFNKLFGR